ncbi:30S ribosomal protein S6 [Candidatus Woesebacteria bacterium RBG_16_34_12]|uniref:Small ribosomal subunit protein bS6 n=1 Tax=Candidatus Woesebacteria bacterium RBG_16_34_12 TaxID=1802480 RepID=A0A1F7XB00_9BACT|nr:MAG: 30S ribosomal protein S6 [Candidatus Woesebacteria bacterium RBG_16_34_12]
MSNYELTVVLPGKSTTAKKKSIQEKIEKLVNLDKGKVVKFEDWGEIELAYQIKKSDTGIFLHFLIELDSDKIKDISLKLKLEEEIIRSLLVKKNK